MLELVGTRTVVTEQGRNNLKSEAACERERKEQEGDSRREKALFHFQPYFGQT